MICGLIGKTLAHSYSGIIHGMLNAYNYNLFPMDEDSVEDFIRSGHFDGLNVTIPYKRKVMEYCDEISDIAREIGAVNTLYFDKDHRLCGTNTDYYGFIRMLERAGIEVSGRKVLLLGNGGTSHTARKALSDLGASEITVLHREEPKRFDYQIIVNTTPVGTYPDNLSRIIDIAPFKELEGVADVIYNPLRTDLLFQAEERGLKYANGLAMLVTQALKAADFFCGKGPENSFLSREDEVLSTLKKSIENIVLIGMPGSGKTTVGKLLAETLKREFIDTDDMIESHDGKSIPEIFEENGEDYFRLAESAACNAAGMRPGRIIATGGGCVLKPENMRALRQNAVIAYLDRPLESLPTDGRPLSAGGDEALRKLFAERAPLYEKYADIKITAPRSAREAADMILEKLF